MMPYIDSVMGTNTGRVAVPFAGCMLVSLFIAAIALLAAPVAKRLFAGVMCIIGKITKQEMSRDIQLSGRIVGTAALFLSAVACTIIIRLATVPRDGWHTIGVFLLSVGSALIVSNSVITRLEKNESSTKGGN